MNCTEAKKHMKAGGKIRYHTWWWGRYLHMPASKILMDDGRDGEECFTQATEWVEFTEKDQVGPSNES